MCLPMDDPVFRARLTTTDLLSPGLKNIVLAKPTTAGMAEYFLDNGIKNDSKSFSRLLTVMQESEQDQLKVLATKIQDQLKILEVG